MAQMQTVQEVMERVVVGSASDRENAIALHDHVRDQVKFGFNRYFDAAPPAYTLSCGYGHCNPKSRLLVALFRALGLESYQHFVVIPKEILRGAIPISRYWLIPRELSHSYVEVNLDGTWYALDSYIVDIPLLRGAKARLEAEGRARGYGVRADSTNQWDGQRDAFSQFEPGMLIEDHGRIDDLTGYFADPAYRNRVLGMPLNMLFQLWSRFAVGPINGRLERIRE
jgi:transglutaminase-like putative cysteine protease